MADPNYLAFRIEDSARRVAAGITSPEIARQAIETIATAYTDQEKEQAAAIVNARAHGRQ